MHPLVSLPVRAQDIGSNIIVKRQNKRGVHSQSDCGFLFFVIKETVNFVFIRVILRMSVVFFTCKEVS